MPSVERVVGYIRVSTEQQGDSGAGLEAQEATILAECARRGWELQSMFSDVASGSTRRHRVALDNALQALHDGDAQALVVAKLDRLSRSLVDFAELTATASKEGWAVVAIDIGVDTTTVNGELVASIIMALAQWERRVLGQRTKDALAAVATRGVRLGRPVTTSGEAETLIAVFTREGKSLAGIARALNDAHIPTPQGGAKWWPSSVHAVARRLARPPVTVVDDGEMSG